MEICARLVKVDRVEVKVGRIFSGNCDTVVVEQLSQQFLLVQTLRDWENGNGNANGMVWYGYSGGKL